MNVKIYEFESHKDNTNNYYYKETLFKDDRCFFIIFNGNKGSKYGYQKGYKKRVGRTGRIYLTLDETREWINEKQAEAREFERATFKMFKKELKKMNKELKDREIGEAWQWYINSAV